MSEVNEVPNEVEVTETEKAKDDSTEVKKLKRQLSEYASEISKHKKNAESLREELNKRLTEDERAEAERKRELDELISQKEEAEKLNKQLQLEKDISVQKAAYLAMGFDDTLAQETAEALLGGDLVTVNKNLNAQFEATSKKAVADAMMGTPTPAVGSESTKAITAESIMAIEDTGERRQAMAEHPELFGIEN